MNGPTPAIAATCASEMLSSVYQQTTDIRLSAALFNEASQTQVMLVDGRLDRVDSVPLAVTV